MQCSDVHYSLSVAAVYPIPITTNTKFYPPFSLQSVNTFLLDAPCVVASEQMKRCYVVTVTVLQKPATLQQPAAALEREIESHAHKIFTTSC